MEHEVFVPVPPASVRSALADPARVGDSVPGLQPDPESAAVPVPGDGKGGSREAPPVAGRLRLRVAGHTITYRGGIRVTARPDGSYGLRVGAVEVRGEGAVTAALTLALAPADGGTRVTFAGTGEVTGRLTELDAPAVASALHRLLNRFAANLGQTGTEPQQPEAEAGAEAGAGARTAPLAESESRADGDRASDRDGDADASAPGHPSDSDDSGDTDSSDDTDDSGDPESDPDAGPDPDPDPDPGPDPDPDPSPHEEPRRSVFDTEVPPSSLGPDDVADLADIADIADIGDVDAVEFIQDPDPGAGPVPGSGDEPPAEAAHARRTMIGRSAEEVDHAPPRGRYAPVAMPTAATPAETLRWAAPAAALVVASAIVAGRVLRRRR